MNWFALACAILGWMLARPAYLAPDLGHELGQRPELVLAVVLWLVAGSLALADGQRRKRPWDGAVVGLALVASVGAANAALELWEAARQPELPLFSWLAYGLLRLAGAPVALQGGHLLAQDPQGALCFAPTFGLTAFRPLLLFWLGGALLHAVQGERRSGPWLRLLLLPLLFFGLRYAWAVLRYCAVDDVLAQNWPPALSLFWSPWSSGLALLAGAAGLAWQAHAASPPPVPHLPGAWRSAALAALAGLSGGAAAYWHDPGIPKSGRVLIDDRLTGAWEPAGRLLDKDRYGDFSSYSFSAMVEHLSHRFSVTVNAERLYTRDYLDAFDVLVLKTPEQPLAEQEIADIDAWVRAGGGLFVVGDHTDLMGMSTHFRPLIRRYGLDFRMDATNDADSGGFDYWQPGMIPGHPITAGMGVFECMTPCSIRLSGNARPVLLLRRSTSTAGDYARGSNFGTRAPLPSDPHGLLVLAASARAGAGRVLAFGDSTVLSSFAYYTWSHADFVARGIAWLNRRNSAAGALFWGFVALAALTAGVAWGMGRRQPALLAAAAALALPVGAALGAFTSATALAVPEPAAGTVRVGFVHEGGHAWLPAVLGTQPELPPNGNLMTFVQTPQRLGLETRIVERDPAVLAGLDVLVILNPDTELGQPEAPAGWVEAVAAWVRRGGRLVITVRREHIGHDHVHDALYTQGLIFEEVESPASGLRLGVAGAGAGRVIVMEGSELLDVDHMGHCMQYPGRDERERYEAAFLVFGELTGLPPPQRHGYRPR